MARQEMYNCEDRELYYDTHLHQDDKNVKELYIFIYTICGCDAW